MPKSKKRPAKGKAEMDWSQEMSSSNALLSDEDLIRIYGALASHLNELPVQTIRNILRAAGFCAGKIPSQSEAQSGSGRRAEVMPAADRQFEEMSFESKLRSLPILAEKLIDNLSQRKPELVEGVFTLLAEHGFQYANKTFVPVGFLDGREAHYLPPSSASELSRAMKRLMEGDDSGAITAACGAVDLVTTAVYDRHNLGKPQHVAFASKVCTILKHLDIPKEMASELQALGIAPSDASSIADNVRKATNDAAQALGILRRSMGDVHGSKPALRKYAYDAIKWSSAICSLLGRNV